jgi:Fe-S-cluster-containing hydrogenase component 2
VVQEYAALALERFQQEEPPVFHLQRPFGYYLVQEAREKQESRTERGWTNPVRVEKECSMCRDCETECPTQAFDADTGLSDPAACIECMRCVYICPDKVIKIDERMEAYYPSFLDYWHLTEEMIDAKRSRIITEPWQAAA